MFLLFDKCVAERGECIIGGAHVGLPEGVESQA